MFGRTKSYAIHVSLGAINEEILVTASSREEARLQVLRLANYKIKRIRLNRIPAKSRR